MMLLGGKECPILASMCDPQPDAISISLRNSVLFLPCICGSRGAIDGYIFIFFGQKISSGKKFAENLNHIYLRSVLFSKDKPC